MDGPSEWMDIVGNGGGETGRLEVCSAACAPRAARPCMGPSRDPLGGEEDADTKDPAATVPIDAKEMEGLPWTRLWMAAAEGAGAGGGAMGSVVGESDGEAEVLAPAGKP